MGNIDHPDHYKGKDHECIEVMLEAIGEDDVKGFCLCNAFKYLYRCKKKNVDPVDDIKKAIWYLSKYLELYKQEDKEKEYYGKFYITNPGITPGVPYTGTNPGITPGVPYTGTSPYTVLPVSTSGKSPVPNA